MRDMAHSICLIKLYQITMRKNFRFFVSDYLKHLLNDCTVIAEKYSDYGSDIRTERNEAQNE